MVKKSETSCSKKMVNKGAWTAEEDQKLADYVKKHGDKKWGSLPPKAGLNRCGKSCRLRWLNYLRPGIKRGNISEDEEDLIIRLHNLLGNRWSLIAGRLPGRTDNEIKNHWNTHLSKKQLSIDELNHKLNQTTPANHIQSSSFLAATSEAENRITMAPPNDESRRSGNAQLASRPWNEPPINEFTETDLDVDRFLDFSSGLFWLESDPNETHQQHVLNGHYHNLLELESQPSPMECSDQWMTHNQLDIDTLTRLLDYEEDAFFSLS